MAVFTFLKILDRWVEVSAGGGEDTLEASYLKVLDRGVEASADGGEDTLEASYL